MIELECYYQYFLILLLIASVFMDFKYDRIANGWIILGMILGVSFRIAEGGLYGMCSAAVSMLLSFCLLYPVYKIGGLGAGDVKLFVVIGSFVPAAELLHIIIVSFMIGAVFSIGKLISEANFRERMQYLFSYLFDVLRAGQWKLYGEDLMRERRKYTGNKIHFALPACISVMLFMGGIY
ncbi:MAG: A24 family peptidase [Roseburia sp.]|nr:A24 family peptidase [Ruminococcus sp.]MCM1155652.1 A24 family peptidase [Roseburia sp.]MCM1241651.1 A24 family peptidase [Roseburia sp.]